MTKLADDIAAIRKIAKDWTDGWNRGDLEAILALYADEPILMPQGQAAVVGQDRAAGRVRRRGRVERLEGARIGERIVELHLHDAVQVPGRVSRVAVAAAEHRVRRGRGREVRRGARVPVLGLVDGAGGGAGHESQASHALARP